MLQHRRLLYDLFTKSYRVKRAAVQARLAQEFGDISKAEVDRLFQVRWVLLLWNSVVCSEAFFSCLPSNLSHVAAGVLQQLCRDVVPQGNDTVMTLTACPLRSPSETNPPPPRCPVGRQSDECEPITAPPALRTKTSDDEAFLLPAVSDITLSAQKRC